MRRALLVQERNGYYAANMTNEPEDWDDVQALALRVKKIDSLLGWAPYTEAYRVYFEYTDGGPTYHEVYFVE